MLSPRSSCARRLEILPGWATDDTSLSIAISAARRSLRKLRQDRKRIHQEVIDLVCGLMRLGTAISVIVHFRVDAKNNRQSIDHIDGKFPKSVSDLSFWSAANMNCRPLTPRSFWV